MTPSSLYASELGRKANMNHGSVHRQVEKLLARRLLPEKRYSHIRIIEAASRSPGRSGTTRWDRWGSWPRNETEPL